jgi:hypothetical protein
MPNSTSLANRIVRILFWIHPFEETAIPNFWVQQEVMQYRKLCRKAVRNSARIFESIYGIISIDVLTHLARLFVTLLRPTSSRRRRVMECHNQKQLHDELIELLDRQRDTLEVETFGGLTAPERREYEERGERIHQLCDELFILRTAA